MKYLEHLSRILLPLLCAVLLATTFVFSGALPLHPVYALGSGRVCVFLVPSAVPLANIPLGHVGWAFRVGQSDHWVFGATEDKSGSPSVDAGGNIDAWVSDGNEAYVEATFYNKGPYHDERYTEFRCKDTPDSAVGSAIQVARNISKGGYYWLTNNCLDHTFHVLNTYYGSSISPFAKVSESPNLWFQQLGSSNGFGPITEMADEAVV